MTAPPPQLKRDMKKTYLPMMIMAAPLCMALDPAAVSMDLTRDSADAQLDKNYTYSAMADVSVRRHWESEKGRSIDLDFDGKTDKLICAIITYDKPVPVKKATRDAKEIAQGSVTWKPLPAENAKKYEVENAQAAKVGNVYLIMECDKSGKCTRLALHNTLPDRNRATMTPVDTDVRQASGAMGSNADILENARLLLTSEERRKAKSTAAPAPVTPTATVEEDTAEPTETPTLMQDPAPQPKADTTPEPDLSTLNKPAAKPEPKERPKGPLDDITPLHWGIGGGALVLLFILWKLCTGRKDDATRLAARASAIRQDSGLTGSTLRARSGLPPRPRR